MSVFDTFFLLHSQDCCSIWKPHFLKQACQADNARAVISPRTVQAYLETQLRKYTWFLGHLRFRVFSEHVKIPLSLLVSGHSLRQAYRTRHFITVSVWTSWDRKTSRLLSRIISVRTMTPHRPELEQEGSITPQTTWSAVGNTVMCNSLPPTWELRHTQSHCRNTSNYNGFPGLLWHGIPQTMEKHCLRVLEPGSPKSRCVWIGSSWGLWGKIWSSPFPRCAGGTLAGCPHCLPSTPVCVKMSPFLEGHSHIGLRPTLIISS